MPHLRGERRARQAPERVGSWRSQKVLSLATRVLAPRQTMWATTDGDRSLLPSCPTRLDRCGRMMECYDPQFVASCCCVRLVQQRPRDCLTEAEGMKAGYTFDMDVQVGWARHGSWAEFA